MRAVLTRDGDYFVPLRDACAARARARPTCSSPSTPIRSVIAASTAPPSTSSRRAAHQRGGALAGRARKCRRPDRRRVARGQGRRARVVLLDLSQSASLNASHAAAEYVLHQLNRVGEVRKPQVQQAGFVVLKSPVFPPCWWRRPTFPIRRRTAPARRRASGQLAAAIHQGLRDYFYDDPPPARASANSPAPGRRRRARIGHGAGDSGGRARPVSRRGIIGRVPRTRCAKMDNSRGMRTCPFEYCRRTRQSDRCRRGHRAPASVVRSWWKMR